MAELLDNMVMRVPYRLLMGPCVYIVRLDSEVLYIGSSGAGIGRPFHPKHHVLRNLLSPNLVIEILACETEEQCRRQEELLIVSLKPKLNKNQPTVDSVARKVLKKVNFKELAAGVAELKREVVQQATDTQLL